MPTVGSLFSGVGGFDLGFEREGFDVAYQVEFDKHAQSVLRRHWPKSARGMTRHAPRHANNGPWPRSGVVATRLWTRTCVNSA